MRKGRDGGEKKKRLMIIVATTSLPAVDRPNADRSNAARSRQFTNIQGPRSQIKFGGKLVKPNEVILKTEWHQQYNTIVKPS